MRSVWRLPGRSNRHRSTPVACAENRAKLTPLPSQVAPSGTGAPSSMRIMGPGSCGLEKDEGEANGRTEVAGDLGRPALSTGCGFDQAVGAEENASRARRKGTRARRVARPRRRTYTEP